MKKNSLLIRNAILCSLFAAFIAVVSPFTVPIGPVPISLATFAIYLAGAIGGRWIGVVSVIIYIAIGLTGLPVFSGMSGGVAKLLGPTGGYLIGYIPLAYITGVFIDKLGCGKKRAAYFIGMILGTAVMYFIGTVWYICISKTNIITAISQCVLIFLPGDTVKIVAASIIGYIIRNRIKDNKNHF